MQKSIPSGNTDRRNAFVSTYFCLKNLKFISIDQRNKVLHQKSKCFILRFLRSDINKQQLAFVCKLTLSVSVQIISITLKYYVQLSLKYVRSKSLISYHIVIWIRCSICIRNQYIYTTHFCFVPRFIREKMELLRGILLFTSRRL